MKLECMIRNAYLSCHADLNTLLSQASIRLEMARYGSETLINHTWHIAIQFYSYPLIGLVESGTYSQERLLIVLGTCQYFLIPSLQAS